MPGNLYCLAGDTGTARRHFEQVHALYAPRAYGEDADPLDVLHMIPASFLVGRDDGLVVLMARLRALYRDTDLIAHPVDKLA